MSWFRLRDSSVRIAAMQLFLCAVRTAASLTSTLIPFVGIAFDLLLLAFWTIALRAHLSSDLSDPNHLSEQPWYTLRSCSVVDGEARDACKEAKITLTLLYFIV